jgi:hypothetical protein
LLDVVTAGEHERKKVSFRHSDIQLEEACNAPLAKELSPGFVTFLERFNERLAF